MAKVAVVLSGCGVYDGAEINEAVLTLLSLEQQGAAYQCFAPDIEQMHVINHLTGESVEGETRNVMVEAARIARGNVLDLAGARAADYDAMLVPGGFGAAKNLCNFAVAGAEMEVQPDFLRVAREFHQAGKPIGLVCIAPVMAAAISTASRKGRPSSTAVGPGTDRQVSRTSLWEASRPMVWFSCWFLPTTSFASGEIRKCRPTFRSSSSPGSRSCLNEMRSRSLRENTWSVNRHPPAGVG